VVPEENDVSALPEPARAFVDGGVDLLPGALSAADVERLVALLVARADAPRLQRLADAPDKAIAKPARRGLHLLRTRGQKLPQPEKREFRVHGPFAAEAEPPSLVSMIDGRGERIVWLVRPGREGAFDVYQAELSETRGLIAFSAGTVAKKEWRLHLRKVVDDPRLVVAEVPSKHARWLIEQGYERTVAEGRVAPPELAASRLELGPVERPEEHPAIALAPPLAPEQARPELARLHELVEVATWIPPKESLDALDLEIGEITTSRLIVDKHQRMEQLDRAIERSANQTFGAAERARWAERLRETAFLVAQRGRLEDARLLNSAAALMADESVAPSDNPFVRRLYDKLIDRERLQSNKETP
jgi:hypothetical protein